ncbi:substrate-binding domain-containing protein [Sorangium sp. So ce1667]
MTINIRYWEAVFALTLMMACGTSNNDDAARNSTPIDRVQVPQNDFIPVELERIIDNLVTETNKTSVQPLRMAVLMKSLESSFAPIATGANRAMNELGAAGRIRGDVLGPLEGSTDHFTSMDLQNQQIAATVADGAKGIAITPVGENNVATIDQAVAKGIPVVTLETDVVTSKRQIYVGILNEPAGAAAGHSLLVLLPPGPGMVLIHGWVEPSWVDGVARTQGAMDVLRAAGYDVLVHAVNDDEAEDVAMMKSVIETADPPVVGLIGMFSDSYRCAMAADAAGAPDLPIVAFDFAPQTVDYMRQGRIKATLVKRQYYEGYLGPYIVYGIKSIGLDATREILAPRMADGGRFDIGIDVVPADKVDVYKHFLDVIGASQ